MLTEGDQGGYFGGSTTLFLTLQLLVLSLKDANATHHPLPVLTEWKDEKIAIITSWKRTILTDNKINCKSICSQHFPVYAKKKQNNWSVAAYRSMSELIRQHWRQHQFISKIISINIPGKQSQKRTISQCASFMCQVNESSCCFKIKLLSIWLWLISWLLGFF